MSRTFSDYIIKILNSLLKSLTVMFKPQNNKKTKAVSKAML